MSRQRKPADDVQRQIDLFSLDGAFAAAPAPAARSIPDGRYQVRVEHVELTTAHSGRPILKWRLRVYAPSCAGSVLWKNHSVTTDNLGWLKHDLRLCGLELDRLSDLPDNLARLIDVELDVSKRTRGGWDNVYFNRRLDHTDRRQGSGTPF
jgi:hypothetical protein